jgi:hypothetical protein
MDINAFILKSLPARVSGSRWGIGVASQYLESIVPCLTGNGLCPTDVFEKSSASEWEKALAESSGQLTYCDPDMILIKGGIARDQSPGSIMDFDFVLTSSRKDRDGDVLESSGAIIDMRMPLLWQHIPIQPVGTYLSTTKHEADIITGKSAILDTSLGRDAAVLVAGGALRISVGFKPIEAEPIIKADAVGAQRGGVSGFRVKKFEIVEHSLVSVPANADAVITAYSRSKLHHPLVKSWAKNQFDARPTIVSGHTCTCGTKSTDNMTTKADPASGQQVQHSTGAVSDDVVGQLGPVVPGKPTDTSRGEVAMSCDGCGLSMRYDLTSVPDGMDLGKMNCPSCGQMMSELPNTAGGGSADPAAGHQKVSDGLAVSQAVVGKVTDGKRAAATTVKSGRTISEENCQRCHKAYDNCAMAMKAMDEMLETAGYTAHKPSDGSSLGPDVVIDTMPSKSLTDYSFAELTRAILAKSVQLSNKQSLAALVATKAAIDEAVSHSQMDADIFEFASNLN